MCHCFPSNIYIYIASILPLRYRPFISGLVTTEYYCEGICYNVLLVFFRFYSLDFILLLSTWETRFIGNIGLYNVQWQIFQWRGKAGKTGKTIFDCHLKSMESWVGTNMLHFVAAAKFLRETHRKRYPLWSTVDLFLL